jgi:hypothetical protein
MGANRIDDTLSLALYDEGASDQRVPRRVLNATLSPLTIDSSTAKACETVTVRSALIRSPAGG